MATDDTTVIIGGGLAGLTCAVRLASAGNRSVQVIEATDRVGGRVRTDHVDGYTLDHGFQVLLTAYPACREWLDYDALRLRRFEPGALIRQSGRFQVLGDPWRRPADALATFRNRVGTLGDKLRVAALRRDSRRGTLGELYTRGQTTTERRLRDAGFSTRFIDQFFRPFLGGVYLDESLDCPSRMLEFVFRMFASGDVAVPADGMGAIPRQLAERLPTGSLRLRSTVTSIGYRTPAENDRPSGAGASVDGPRIRVALASGDRIDAARVVLATESDTAARLLGDDAIATPWSGTTNFYYAADAPPDGRRMLILRGDESGPIGTAVVVSNVAPEYAPPGKSLVSVSIDAGEHDPETGDVEELDRRVREQLAGWFDGSARSWRRLRTFRVPYGLPRLELDPVELPVERSRLGDREVPPGTLYVCGDYRETPSIQGAMNSGLRVADAILRTPSSNVATGGPLADV